MAKRLAKRLTWSDLKATAAQATRESTVRAIALQDAINGSITWLPAIKETDGDGTYTFGYSRLSSASGGYLFTRFHLPGQVDSVDVAMLEEVWRDVQDNPQRRFSSLALESLNHILNERTRLWNDFNFNH